MHVVQIKEVHYAKSPEHTVEFAEQAALIAQRKDWPNYVQTAIGRDRDDAIQLATKALESYFRRCWWTKGKSLDSLTFTVSDTDVQNGLAFIPPGLTCGTRYKLA